MAKHDGQFEPISNSDRICGDVTRRLAARERAGRVQETRYRKGDASIQFVTFAEESNEGVQVADIGVNGHSVHAEFPEYGLHRSEF